MTADRADAPHTTFSDVSLADGARIRVRTGDRGGATGRPPLVWGHGLTGSMAADDEFGLIDWSVAGAGRTVFRYDARGHGSSDAIGDPERGRWDLLADDQSQLVDRFGFDRYVAAGASMGCATALFAALTRPERIAALVLVIPPTAWATRAEQVSQYVTMADLLDAGRRDVLLAGVDQAPVPDPVRDDPRWADRARNALLTTDPARLAMVFRGAALADLPPPERLATLELPALILSWTGDPGHPHETAQRLAGLLPAAQWYEAATAADLARWSACIAEFLVDHDGERDHHDRIG